MAIYINLERSGSGYSGTEVDPWSFTDLVTNTPLPFDTYRIKGRIQTSNKVAVSGTNPSFEKWENDIWAIESTYVQTGPTDYAISFESTDEGILSDGLLIAEGIRIGGGIVKNFTGRQTGSNPFSSLGNNGIGGGGNWYGVTIDCPLSSVQGGGPPVARSLNDCIIRAVSMVTPGYDIPITFNRCALTFSDPSLTGVVFNNCQLSWPAASWSSAAYNAPKESFSSQTLAADITTPPQPGTPPYTGYATDPWGAARTGIGALSFYVPRVNTFSQATATPGEVVTSTIDPSTVVSFIQAAGTDTYFDSTAEIHSVVVRYTHQDGRQRTNILHRGPGLVGQVSWAAVARDGTWEKDRIITTDAAGAQNTLLRASIGTDEDIVMSDGTMTLNT